MRRLWRYKQVITDLQLHKRDPNCTPPIKISEIPEPNNHNNYLLYEVRSIDFSPAMEGGEITSGSEPEEEQRAFAWSKKLERSFEGVKENRRTDTNEFNRREQNTATPKRKGSPLERASSTVQRTLNVEDEKRTKRTDVIEKISNEIKALNHFIKR